MFVMKQMRIKNSPRSLTYNKYEHKKEIVMSLMRRAFLHPTVDSNWNIWREFDDILRTAVPEKTFSPKAEIQENAKGYLLSFDVPGIKEDDIKIDFNDSVLRIYGERKSEHKEETAGTFHTEKYYGHFERSFKVPESIDDANIEAHHNNGVLQVFYRKPQRENPSKSLLKRVKM